MMHIYHVSLYYIMLILYSNSSYWRCSKVGYRALWCGDLELQLWPLQRLREERAAL